MVKIFNRLTKQQEEEIVCGEKFLCFLYRKKILSRLVLFFVTHFTFCSNLYALLQRRKKSVKKILPFIKTFQIDPKEFSKNVAEFSSFEDFFTRTLKPESRPIVKDPQIAITPADGRYLVYPNIHASDLFSVKGKNFSLETFLNDFALAEEFSEGSLVIARLCPADYHRFHFSFDCTIEEKPRLINGPLYSVHPIALKDNFFKIFYENKRVLTILHSKIFGKVAWIEVGATLVGHIFQTFSKDSSQHKKGEEKGFFSFGGSTIVLLFQKDKIVFDADLIENSKKNLETKCLFGESLGTSL